MFKKILIANRGEIACRVIQTAKKLGVLSVAVYSDADKNALHVRLADEAIHIGASPAAQSYLHADNIIQAARRTAAEAIHPGYGFLSENAAFCEKCARENLVFIGPPAQAIAAMGSKSAAKAIMENAAVPTVPGYHGDDQDPERLRGLADAMGYPVLLKAAAGGGGRGMRPVHRAEQFAAALMEAKRESMASFGDDHMLIEKYLARPRHVEVQVFCDRFGNGVYLYDRDCSIQRRHQKVIEEAPAPDLPAQLRQAMGAAAVRAAQAIDYVGAGTIEFLVTNDHAGDYQFYFMEMNTRLQVEHPVTELVCGQDLVEWQLRIAAGEQLPLRQEDIPLTGHAFEARIYAEDPERDFCPSAGRLIHLRPPAQDRHVRVDSGVVEGDEVSPFYDPMIAKLIVWDVDREKARKRMLKALGDYQVAGVASNIALLERIFSQPAFRRAELDTHFIDTHAEEIFAAEDAQQQMNIVLAALYLLLRRKQRRQRRGDRGDVNSPWSNTDSWRLNQRRVEHGSITLNQQSHSISAEEFLSGDAAYYVIACAEHQYRASGQLRGKSLLADVDGYRLAVSVVDHDDTTSTLITRRGNLQFQVDAPDIGQADEPHGAGGCAAPMNGRILDILVREGQTVAKGDELIVMEAMKMEHTITAPYAGAVEKIFCRVDELVAGGADLLALANAQ